MSREDQQKRKEKEPLKKEAKKASHELERKLKAANRDMPDVVDQLDVRQRPVKL